MLNIGPAEVLVIALIALIVVGPEQLPGVLRKIGKGAGQLRSMADGLKKDFMSGMDELDPNNWAEGKPRGTGTTTDPIIGPGAYGTVPESETKPVSETEGKSTRQLAEEKAARDAAAADAAQPITKPQPPAHRTDNTSEASEASEAAQVSEPEQSQAENLVEPVDPVDPEGEPQS